MKLKELQFTFFSTSSHRASQPRNRTVTFECPPKICFKKYLAKTLPAHGTYTFPEALQKTTAP
jgi:hypothetical protein